MPWCSCTHFTLSPIAYHHDTPENKEAEIANIRLSFLNKASSVLSTSILPPLQPRNGLLFGFPKRGSQR